MFPFVLLLTVLLLPANVQAQAQPATTASPETLQSRQQSFVVPFTTPTPQGAPLIHVWINESVDATFVVDTGTNTLLISQSLVKKLGLKTTPVINPDGTPFLFEGKQTQGVTLTSLRLGGQFGLVKMQPVNGTSTVLPDQQLRISANCVVDGLISGASLSPLAIGFDFAGHMMTFTYPGNLTPSEARDLGYGGTGGTTLPLLVNANKFYSVQVGLENGGTTRKADLLVDTGGERTGIPRLDAQALSLSPLRQLPQAGFSGTFMDNEAMLSTLVLGDLRLTRLLVTYGITSDHTPRLGLDILSGYKVLLDFPAKKMYLQPIPLAKHNIVTASPASAPAAPTPAK